MIDISDYPHIVAQINACLNENKTIELKNESHRKDIVNLVIVEVKRKVLTSRFGD